jgi:hypothetical protein
MGFLFFVCFKKIVRAESHVTSFGLTAPNCPHINLLNTAILMHLTQSLNLVGWFNVCDWRWFCCEVLKLITLLSDQCMACLTFLEK